MAQYTLEQIKSHPSFPFSDLENNSLSFLMLELYWSQLFSEKMKDEGKNWSSLIEAEMDGNPILCVTSLSQKRQLKIIQKTNEEHKPVYPLLKGEGVYYPLQAWLNNSRTFDGNTVLNELVLFSDLSLHAEKEVLKLIQLHCIDLAGITIVERAIQGYENRVDMPD